MKYYKVRLTWGCSIEEVEVEKESESSVWIKGRANRRVTAYESFFKNKEDAVNFALIELNRRVERASDILEYAKEELENFNQSNK